MQSKAKTVAEYIASLPEERQGAIKTVRSVIKKHLPEGYKEGMDYGYIGWSVPLSAYPDTYNGQPLCYAALASQKNHLALYLMCVYGNKEVETWFREEFRKAGKKLDMGKSCVRFRKLEDLPLKVIGQTIKRVPPKAYITRYEASRER